jgi:type 1 glutamine amidotransferase
MRRLLIAAFALLVVSFPLPAQDAKAPKPIKALLVIGGGFHDYKTQKDALAKGISARGNIDVVISYDSDKGTKHLNPAYEKPDWSKGYDIVIHDECCADISDKAIVDRILQPHRDGLPAVVLHCGMHSFRVKSDEWFKFTGLTTRSHGDQLPIAISFNPDSPITKNLVPWTTINEELYKEERLWKTASPLAKGKQRVAKGKQQENDYVVAWTNTYNEKTKVFATTLGHNNATVEDPRYLDLVTNGLLWATGHLTNEGRPAAGYEAKK